MNVEYINPFLEATMNVLKTMAFIESKTGKPSLKKGKEAYGDVSGIIGLTGATEGSLSVTFTQPCIEQILTSMFGEPVNGITDEVKDAVGEITNMISGDARRVLSEKGISLNAAIPTIVAGPNHSITHLAKGPTIVIPFSTEAGSFTVEVSLND